MVDYLVSMAINIILTTITMAIKNPGAADKYKRALLKLKTQIELLFPGE